MLIRIATLRITCSQFQQPSPTAATRGEAEICICNLKKTSPSQCWSQAVVCISTPRMYPRIGYFLAKTILTLSKIVSSTDTSFLVIILYTTIVYSFQAYKSRCFSWDVRSNPGKSSWPYIRFLASKSSISEAQICWPWTSLPLEVSFPAFRITIGFWSCPCAITH